MGAMAGWCADGGMEQLDVERPVHARRRRDAHGLGVCLRSDAQEREHEEEADPSDSAHEVCGIIAALDAPV